MCLEVYANGHKSAKGRNLSLYLRIMRGPKNGFVVWPMQGVLYVSILNQLKDSNQYTMDVDFNWEIRSQVLERKRSSK